MAIRKTTQRVGVMQLIRKGHIAFGVDGDQQGVFFLDGKPVDSKNLRGYLNEMMGEGLLNVTTTPVTLNVRGQQLYGMWTTEVLSPTRREMLRQVAITEVSAHRDGAQQLSFGPRHFDGTSTNALAWLMFHGGYITTNEVNELGFPVGQLELTAKGRRWMQLNIPSEKLR